MSAIKGETTMLSPALSTAGNWKQRDLPPPVGMSASTSLPASTSRTTASWPGRKSSNPKIRCSAAPRSVMARHFTERWAAARHDSPREPRKTLGGRRRAGRSGAGAVRRPHVSFHAGLFDDTDDGGIQSEQSAEPRLSCRVAWNLLALGHPVRIAGLELGVTAAAHGDFHGCQLGRYDVSHLGTELLPGVLVLTHGLREELRVGIRGDQDLGEG